MAVNNNYLLGLFGGTYDPAANAALGSAITRQRQPTAPWSTQGQATAPAPDALVRGALGGRKFINEDTAQVDVRGASADYAKLFALYRGLETLNALANRASVKGLGSGDLGQLCGILGRAAGKHPQHPLVSIGFAIGVHRIG